DAPAENLKHATEMAVALPLVGVDSTPAVRTVLLSYTEGWAFEYMHQRLRPWWQRDGKTVSSMLDDAQFAFAELDKRGDAFDRQLTADMTATGGEHYAWLCTLAYRQAIAAHKLVSDVD